MQSTSVTSLPPLPTFYFVVLVISILSVIINVSFWLITFISKIKRDTTYNYILNLSLIFTLQSFGLCLNWIHKNEEGGKTVKYLYIPNNELCIFQSILDVFPFFSSEFWISILVSTFYYEMSEVNKKVKSLDYDDDILLYSDILIPKITLPYKIISYCIGYGIPLILVIIYWSCGILGKGSFNCWIVSGEGEPWKIALIIIKAINILFSLIFSVLIIINQKTSDNNRSCLSCKGKNLKIIIIPLIQFVGALPTYIYRITKIFNSKSEILSPLAYIDVTILDLQGILYCLFFIYICGLPKIICCKKKQEKKIETITQLPILDS